jgi:heme-degrading monooxygenase HmoA
MFEVVFEVHPRPEQWDAYLGNAKMLRPELEQIDGFVDNVRYKSLTRDGWIVSLSSWRDEKALVRWRARQHHHEVQEKGRAEILLDYHLRVGQVTHDTRVPDGFALTEQRLDETQAGEGTTVVLINARLTAGGDEHDDPAAVAERLGFVPQAPGLVGWDVFDAVLTPGDFVLLLSWRTALDAEAFVRRAEVPEGGRLRAIRVVRDYGLLDRREAPQFYPDVVR